MKEIIIALILATVFLACTEQSNSQDEIENQEENGISTELEQNDISAYKQPFYNKIEPFGNVYVCYDCHPGNKAEFLQIGLDESMKEILVIFYWTDQFEDPMRLIIHEQRYEEGEISGITAKIGWPENAIKAELGIIENKANILYEDGLFHEFWIENEE
jgi:hypothetical protein